MVDVYASEAEQVEQLKRIWKDYGIAIVVGVALALLIGFGWRYYQYRHERTLEHASMRYEQLITNVVNNNTAAVENQANRLMNRYPHTPYASFAALLLARQDVYLANLSDAEDKLRWVMKHGTSLALRDMSKVRLARVLIAENKPQNALDLLNGKISTAYVAAAWEVQGDALLALEKPAEAKAAYKNALANFPGYDVIRPVLQMKIDELAGVQAAGVSS